MSDLVDLDGRKFPPVPGANGDEFRRWVGMTLMKHGEVMARIEERQAALHTPESCPLGNNLKWVCAIGASTLLVVGALCVALYEHAQGDKAPPPRLTAR